jgi:hypothetical protein
MSDGPSTGLRVQSAMQALEALQTHITEGGDPIVGTAMMLRSLFPEFETWSKAVGEAERLHNARTERHREMVDWLTEKTEYLLNKQGFDWGGYDGAMAEAERLCRLAEPLCIVIKAGD